MLTVGAVPDTANIVIVAEVVEFPRLSVETAVMSYNPGAPNRKLMSYVDVRSTPAATPFTKNSTCAIVPSASVAVAVIAIGALAVSVASSNGTVTTAVGAAPTTVTENIVTVA